MEEGKEPLQRVKVQTSVIVVVFLLRISHVIMLIATRIVIIAVTTGGVVTVVTSLGVITVSSGNVRGVVSSAV